MRKKEERAKRILSMGQVMNRYVENTNFAKKIRENQSINIWPQIVGSRISQVTKPVRISEGILYVKVKNDVWRNEIVYQTPVIKDNINHELGGNIVKDIKLI